MHKIISGLPVVTFASVIIMMSVLCTKDPAGPGTGISIGTPVTDIDGNVYTTVNIGGQVWTAENLRTTRFNDGTPIPYDSSAASWESVSPKCCYYQNATEEENRSKYGALYNWYTVATGKLAPAGWHVPSSDEWLIMENFLVQSGYNWDGNRDIADANKLGKALAATTDWNPSPSTGAPGNDLTSNNTSGFAALPGGLRDFVGNFKNRNTQGCWWSSTERDADYANYRLLKYDASFFSRTFDVKSCGFSVRLVKN